MDDALARALDRLRNPRPGGKIEAAKAFGVDISLLIEQIQLTPAERARRMHGLAQAAESVRGAARKPKTRTSRLSFSVFRMLKWTSS